MTAVELSQVITAVASMIAALSGLAAVVISVFNHGKIQVVTAKVEAVHLATNSMQDKLIAATTAAATAASSAAVAAASAAAAAAKAEGDRRWRDQ